jgi:hypothetical protein
VHGTTNTSGQQDLKYIIFPIRTRVFVLVRDRLPVMIARIINPISPAAVAVSATAPPASASPHKANAGTKNSTNAISLRWLASRDYVSRINASVCRGLVAPGLAFSCEPNAA